MDSGEQQGLKEWRFNSMKTVGRGNSTVMDEKLKEALEGIYENLTHEQKEKAKACKTMEEMIARSGEWGIELPDEVVDAVAGGIGIGGCHTHCFEYDYNKDVQAVP